MLSPKVLADIAQLRAEQATGDDSSAREQATLDLVNNAAREACGTFFSTLPTWLTALATQYEHLRYFEDHNIGIAHGLQSTVNGFRLLFRRRGKSDVYYEVVGVPGFKSGNGNGLKSFDFDSVWGEVKDVLKRAGVRFIHE